MFKGKKKQINPNITDTLVGEGSQFEGRIKSEASLRIEGMVTGDVECTGDVIVGEHGVVKSNIIARNIIIAGSVHGNIMTKGMLKITSSGKLFGNTTTASLMIDEGGTFQGTSKMESKAAQTEKHENEEKNQPTVIPFSQGL
ncbi:polymer-forming cytoskeletal protein [Paenibacillus psychroresistens]|uniref:Polymer-forming cytoskeletal protein n=1 Tax=Paenibacillus psychroresistens TaxID=1778678 RepID=A0A6B8RBR0_9BACL|nr:polymer-forming cytoskeletal protein [Paenibacillus psychroresistens]QGQ93557.1 polymer-forming cytoskeletal protein [Paenibacillus psychroresistens]